MATGADPRSADNRQWRTLTEVAQALGLSRQAVHARVRKGQLAGEKVDGVWRVSDAAVVNAVESKRRKALSLGSLRLLPAAPAGGPVGDDVIARLEALEALVADLRDGERRARAERDRQVAALEERCALMQAALHQMVDLLASAGLADSS